MLQRARIIIGQPYRWREEREEKREERRGRRRGGERWRKRRRMDGMVECTALLECCRTAAHTIGGRRSAYVEGYEGDRRYTRGLDGTVGIGGGGGR
jgi:hypothetical protein